MSTPTTTCQQHDAHVKETDMAKKTTVLTVHGTASTPAPGKVAVHSADDLAERIAAAKAAGLTYETREV